MSENTTPGQCAFEAYAAARFPDDATHVPTPYAHLSHAAQRAWEAAAQAAITAWWQAHEAVICGDKKQEEPHG